MYSSQLSTISHSPTTRQLLVSAILIPPLLTFLYTYLPSPPHALSTRLRDLLSSLPLAFSSSKTRTPITSAPLPPPLPTFSPLGLPNSSQHLPQSLSHDAEPTEEEAHDGISRGAETSIAPLPPFAYAYNIWPGARDVASPYGSLRVYEWGPVTGPKILLVHGISTPCVGLGALARGLADRGARVCFFDLFGRGWSGTPTGIPQDSKLFTTQILLAITSSPVSWTSPNTSATPPTPPFTLMGYSLGGGIAMSFAAHFPHLISSIVLLAPSGLVRNLPADYQTVLAHADWQFLPRSWLVAQVRHILCGGVHSRVTIATAVAAATQTAAVVAVPGDPHHPPAGMTGLSVQATERPMLQPRDLDPRERPLVEADVVDVMHWQIDCNAGFVDSFIGSLRHGPVSNQHREWRMVGRDFAERAEKAKKEEEERRRMTTNKEEEHSSTASAKSSQNILIILGEHDPYIICSELQQDATEMLGGGNVEFVVMDDGHEFPLYKSNMVADEIGRFLGLGGGLTRRRKDRILTNCGERGEKRRGERREGDRE